MQTSLSVDLQNSYRAKDEKKRIEEQHNFPVFAMLSTIFLQRLL